MLADRRDRRRLVLVANLAATALFVTATVVAFTAVTPLWILYTLAVGLGTVETVRDTTMSAAVPALVDRDDLERANGRLVTVEFVANQLAGPALGAALFATAAVLPFGTSAALTAGAALLCARLPTLHRHGPDGADSAGASRRRRITQLTEDVRAGIAFLTSHRILRRLVLLAIVVTSTDAAWFSVLVLLITDELGQPSAAYGMALAAAALGGAAGGILADRVIARLGWTAVMRGTLLVIGLAQLALGFSRSLPVAIVALAVGNAGIAVWMTAGASLRHRLTPDRILGRVTATGRTAALGVIPIGMLAGGLIADTLGVRGPFLAGVPLVIGAALFVPRVSTDNITPRTS